jgi:general secretion pathway protein K
MMRMIRKLNIKNNDNRGIAVIMALSVVLLLVTAAMELHINERENMLNAAALRDRSILQEMGKSGVQLAMAVLIKDRMDSEIDSLQEDWADEETLTGLIGEIPFEQGQLDVKIIDEMAKIQINALVRFPQGQSFDEQQYLLWQRFIGHILSVNEDLEDTDAATIINSAKDWLDSGDDDAITGLSGAESDYYESLDPPYACKNGPFDHLSEVRLVKGITPEIFAGLGGASGLGNYITVYGATKSGDDGFTFEGKININTAELPVLAALLPAESSMYAQGMVDYREALDGSQYTHNDLTNINWYKNVPGLSDVVINPALITVSSDIFRIVASAKLNGVISTTTAVIQREKASESDPWHCKILNWKTQ